MLCSLHIFFKLFATHSLLGSKFT